MRQPTRTTSRGTNVWLADPCEELRPLNYTDATTRRSCFRGISLYEKRLLPFRAEGIGGVRTGANAGEMIVAVDSGGVAVIESDLNGVIANDGGGLRSRFGLEHRQHRRRSAPGGGKHALLLALFVARGARALVAQVPEIVVAGVAFRPSGIDAGAAGDVNLYGRGLFS